MDIDGNGYERWAANRKCQTRMLGARCMQDPYLRGWEKEAIDPEWIELMATARLLGISIEEVRDFLQNYTLLRLNATELDNKTSPS